MTSSCVEGILSQTARGEEEGGCKQLSGPRVGLRMLPPEQELRDLGSAQPCGDSWNPAQPTLELTIPTSANQDQDGCSYIMGSATTS